MEPINQIAAGLGIKEEHLIPFGRYKAKISMDAMNDAPAQERRGKLVVVTGMTPTPAGEGKTTTAIGLTQGMGRLGHRAVVNLREPSLGPIFGIKGGGTVISGHFTTTLRMSAFGGKADVDNSPCCPSST